MASSGNEAGTEIQYSLAVNTEMAYSDLRRIELILFRTLSYIKRLSGDENLNGAIMQIQKTITWLRTLQISLRALEAASGPIGWAYAAITMVGVGFASYEMTRQGV